MVFNSLAEWRRYREQALAAREHRPQLSFGLRINPEHSEGTTPIYDPCAPGSRLGTTRAQLEQDARDAGLQLTTALEDIQGLHFHTLCEQLLPPLERTVAAVEAQFGDLLSGMQWVNFGGGHWITADGYDIDGLVSLIRRVADTYAVQVYLEPGEAVAIHSGVLVCEVLAIASTDHRQTILDTSATCHMPDTLEMPYRPHILGAGEPGEYAHTYRLGGMTCLAGDVIGDYSFAEPLRIGQRLVFDDMAHYTMVKTTTFNGIPLPAIAAWDSRDDTLTLVREFGYEDFVQRLS